MCRDKCVGLKSLVDHIKTVHRVQLFLEDDGDKNTLANSKLKPQLSNLKSRFNVQPQTTSIGKEFQSFFFLSCSILKIFVLLKDFKNCRNIFSFNRKYLTQQDPVEHLR